MLTIDTGGGMAKRNSVTTPITRLDVRRKCIKERKLGGKLRLICKKFYCTPDEVLIGVQRQNVRRARRMFFQQMYAIFGSYAAAGHAIGFDHTSIREAVLKGA